jgi:hypothetical protein
MVPVRVLISNGKPADHPGAASTIREVKVWLVMPCFLLVRVKLAGHPFTKDVFLKRWNLFKFRAQWFPALKRVGHRAQPGAVIREVESQVVMLHLFLRKDVTSCFFVPV